MAMIIPTIKQCVDAIGIRTMLWQGHCHEIASALNEAGLFPGARLAYGHYHGPIDPNGYFGHRHGGIPPRHGWLIMPDGVIMDPTLWVFLHKTPYIGVSLPGTEQYDYYDLGGERIFEALGKDVVPSEQELTERGAMWMEHTDIEWPSQCWPLLDRLYGGHERLLAGYVYHLANRGPLFLGEDAAPLYETIIRSGRRCWIPIDYRTEALGNAGEDISAATQSTQPKRRTGRACRSKRV